MLLLRPQRLVFFRLHWRLADLTARPAAVNPSFSNSAQLWWIYWTGALQALAYATTPPPSPQTVILDLVQDSLKEEKPSAVSHSSLEAETMTSDLFGRVGGSSDSLPAQRWFGPRVSDLSPVVQPVHDATGCCCCFLFHTFSLLRTFFSEPTCYFSLMPLR